MHPSRMDLLSAASSEEDWGSCGWPGVDMRIREGSEDYPGGLTEHPTAAEQKNKLKWEEGGFHTSKSGGCLLRTNYVAVVHLT